MRYEIVISSNFKKQYKKVGKQGKDLNKLNLLLVATGSHAEVFTKM